jgi:hypothetical protein
MRISLQLWVFGGGGLTRDWLSPAPDRAVDFDPAATGLRITIQPRAKSDHATRRRLYP